MRFWSQKITWFGGDVIYLNVPTYTSVFLRKHTRSTMTAEVSAATIGANLPISTPEMDSCVAVAAVPFEHIIAVSAIRTPTGCATTRAPFGRACNTLFLFDSRRSVRELVRTLHVYNYSIHMAWQTPSSGKEWCCFGCPEHWIFADATSMQPLLPANVRTRELEYVPEIQYYSQNISNALDSSLNAPNADPDYDRTTVAEAIGRGQLTLHKTPTGGDHSRGREISKFFNVTERPAGLCRKRFLRAAASQDIKPSDLQCTLTHETKGFCRCLNCVLRSFLIICNRFDKTDCIGGKGCNCIFESMLLRCTGRVSIMPIVPAFDFSPDVATERLYDYTSPLALRCFEIIDQPGSQTKATITQLLTQVRRSCAWRGSQKPKDLDSVVTSRLSGRINYDDIVSFLAADQGATTVASSKAFKTNLARVEIEQALVWIPSPAREYVTMALGDIERTLRTLRKKLDAQQPPKVSNSDDILSAKEEREIFNELWRCPNRRLGFSRVMAFHERLNPMINLAENETLTFGIHKEIVMRTIAAVIFVTTCEQVVAQIKARAQIDSHEPILRITPLKRVVPPCRRAHQQSKKNGILKQPNDSLAEQTPTPKRTTTESQSGSSSNSDVEMCELSPHDIESEQRTATVVEPPVSTEDAPRCDATVDAEQTVATEPLCEPAKDAPAPVEKKDVGAESLIPCALLGRRYPDAPLRPVFKEGETVYEPHDQDEIYRGPAPTVTPLLLVHLRFASVFARPTE